MIGPELITLEPKTRLGHRTVEATRFESRRRVSSRVGFSPASRNRLTDYDLGRFPGDTLLDHVARAACHAAVPRKES